MQSCRSLLDYFRKGEKTAETMGENVHNRYLDAVATGQLDGKKKPMDVILDAVAESTVSGLLSNPASWLIQIVSGVTQAVLMPLVRMAQGLVTLDAKVATEGGAMLVGAVQGFKEFLPFMRQGWARGMPLDIDLERGMTKGEYKTLLEAAGLTDSSSPQQIRQVLLDRYDYINQGIQGPLGDFIRIPTRIIVALDEGMKAVFRRQKYNAFAYRKAMEITDNGKKGDVWGEMQKLTGVNLADPTESEKAWKFIKASDDDSIGELSALAEAQDYAKLNAFQQRLFGVAQQMQKARAEHKALIFAIPFLKSPYNILKEGSTFIPGVGWMTGKLYKKATSVAKVSNLTDTQKTRFAELSSKFELTPSEMKEFAVLRKRIGGKSYVKMENSEIAARQLLGVGAMVTASQLFDEGMITGKLPEDPAEREAWRANGIPEFAIRVGDQWVSYRKVEPLSTVFGLVSDMNRLYDDFWNNHSDPTIEEWDRVSSGIHASLVQNIMGKSFMEGLSNVVNLIAGGATGNDAGQLQSFAANLGRVVIPYGAFLNSVAISMDGENAPDGKRWDRQATTVLEKLQQRIPGFRESLPLMYGIYGEARTLNVADVWNGFKTSSEVNRTELQQELATMGVAYAPINRSLKEDLKLNNDELGELRQIAAETITPMLEQVILSPAFQQLPESVKEKYFKQVMRTGRSAATKLFVAKNIGRPDFQARYNNAIIKSKGLQDLMGFYTVPE
jgi:hypothetical protein